MKGRPIAEFALVAAVFCVLAVPLSRLSGLGSPQPPQHIEHGHAHVGEDGGSNVTAWATLHFAHPPLHVHIHQGSRDLWHLDPKRETEFETELTLELHDGFAELIVHVDWPEGTPESVAELTLEPDGLAGQTKSSWGRVNLDTVWAFQW